MSAADALSAAVALPEHVWINGSKVRPARVDGKSQDVVNSGERHFALLRARWVPDEEATVCLICDQRFNQVRRKHHCRVCGHVLCNKCCFDKLPIPQYEYVEPERVCEACKPVTSFVSKSLSQLQEFQQQAADGLLSSVNSTKDLLKVIEVGGIQALVHLSKSRSQQTQAAVVSAFHGLTLHEPVIPLLLLCGATQAICNCLLSLPTHLETATSDGLLALTTLCKTCAALRTIVFSYRVVEVLSKQFSAKPYLMLLSAQLLSLLIEGGNGNSNTSAPLLLHGNCDILAKLWCMSVEDDEQIQETALRILSVMSHSENEEHKRLILQSNPDVNSVLCKTLKSRVKTPQVLVNAVCLTANLATSKQCLCELATSHLIPCLCELTVTFPHNVTLLRHVYRALANLAENRQNAQQLVIHSNTMVKVCFQGNTDSELRVHALRLLINLMEHHHVSVMDMLLTDSDIIREVVKQLIRPEVGLCAAVRGCLLSRAGDSGRPE